jgi:NADPH:quinone reductase-like Zn-dependent oxidoreductase
MLPRKQARQVYRNLKPLRAAPESAMSDPVQKFLQGMQSLDAKAIAAPFAVDVLLTDEFRQHRGRAKVQAWAQEALVAHKATVDILDTSNQPQGRYIVHVKMDGDFEADYGITDPFDLWMHFEVAQCGITRLTINPFPPSTRTVHAAWAASGNLSDPLSSLRVAERPFPSKPTTAHDWVLVKMHSASLNQHDIFTLKGIGLKTLTFPLTLGNDGVCWRCGGGGDDDDSSGTVSDEAQLYLIYNVINDPSWPAEQDGTLDPGRSVLGEQHQGVLSTYAWIPASNLIPIPTKALPKALAPTHLAALGTAWLTAYRGLFVSARPALSAARDPTILVQGSSGGVATALIQLAHVLGYTVYVAARSPAKAASAKALGATQVFAPEEVVQSADRKPIDVVFNLAGGATYTQALQVVRAGGTVVVCGMHAGEPEAGLLSIFGNGLTVKGVYEGTKEELEALMRFVIEKGIVPKVEDEVLPLARVGEGLERLVTGQLGGKIVISLV